MNQDALVSNLKDRDSVHDVSVIGPVILVRATPTTDTYLFMAKNNDGYRVGAVFPKSRVILYIPNEWGEEAG